MHSLPKEFRKMFVLVSTMALAVLIWTSLRAEWTGKAIIDLSVFGVLAILSESLPVELPKGGYVSVGYAVVFAAILLFPLEAFPIVSCVAGLFAFRSKTAPQPLYKRIFNASQYVVSMFSAGMVLAAFGQTSFRFSFESILVYLAVALTYGVVNITLVAIALGFLQGKSPWSIWASNIRWSAPNFLALSSLGLLMALVYQNYGSLGLLFLFIPLLLSRHSFQLYMDMRQNYLDTIKALVQALEAKDSYTSGHSGRVAELAVAMAEELGLSEDKQESLKYAGILHDVGKIGLDERILNKKGPLLESELEAVRAHPVTGENIIKKINFLFNISPAVRHHHERFDGTGYPDGLKGEEIPLEARIIAVADSYDAMTSNRSYRKGRTKAEALRELQLSAGTQLDPEMVKTFLKVVGERPSGVGSSVTAKMA